MGNLLPVSFYEGLAYGLVAIGVYITFRVLAFPDLTVDGSFPLGGAVSAVLIINVADPWLATLAALAAGVCAGLGTSLLNTMLIQIGNQFFITCLTCIQCSSDMSFL